jgi:putative ABC transport system permease protein
MMTKLTFRGLWSHKRRFTGAFMAVFLGVAFLTGTLIVSDTLGSSIESFLTQTYSGTDVVVRNSTQVENSPIAPRGAIPSSIVNSVRSVPGLATAEPVIEGSGQLLKQDGSLIQTQGPRQASNWIADPDLNPYHIVEGRAPQASGEVVIDKKTAKDNDLKVGDTTGLLTPQRIDVTIVGIARYGSSDAFGGGSYVGMTLADAQRYLVSAPDQITSISVKAQSDVSSSDLRQRIQAVLPTGTEAITGQALAQENFDSVNQGFLTLFRTFLVSFAGVALVVSLFSMYNTFSIIVAQRTRESAMLRAIGASRRQVLWSVVIEGAAVGLVASVVGFAGGIGVAALLASAFKAGLGMPINGLSVTPLAAAIAIGTGLVVTLLASLRPAVQASRISPMAAIRAAEIESATPSRTGLIAGVVLLVVGIGFVIAGAGTALPMVGVGALATIVGVTILGPYVVKPVSLLIGAPAARLRGMPGRLARGNAIRSPRRTARSATALFLGVGVVTVFTILVSSLSAGLNNGISDSLASDLVISSGNLQSLGFSPQLSDRVAALAPVEHATAIGNGSALIDGSSASVSTLQPDQLGNLMNLAVTDGSLASLRPDQLAVTTKVAQKHGWSVGTKVPVTFVDGTTQDFTIGTLFEANNVLNDYLMPSTTWNAHESQPRDTLLLIKLKPGVSLADGKAAVAQVARATGAPKVQTRAEFIDAQTAMFGTIRNVAYALLAFAIVIALMGIGNTLSLSIYERTRELGLLRAVGASAGQLRAIVRWESVIVSVLGTTSGILLGLFIGWGMASAIAQSGTSSFTLPVVPIIVILIVGGLAGVIAAIRPAGRAAKLNVLDAIQVE